MKGAFRSIMNVPFILPSDELNAKFIKEATEEGLTTLKGHRTVGGMRASIYNAMPSAGVKALVDFMKKFELENKMGFRRLFEKQLIKSVKSAHKRDLTFLQGLF